MSYKTWAKTFAIVYFTLSLLLAAADHQFAAHLLAFSAGLFAAEGWTT